MLNIYNNLLVFFKDNKGISLKFEYLEDGIYVYDMLLPIENQKKIRVESINGISIEKLSDGRKIDFSLIKDNLVSNMVIILNEDENILETNFEELVNNNILMKKHDVNPILDIGHEILEHTTMTQNSMSDNASTNVKGLALLLKNLSKSTQDKLNLSKFLDVCNTNNDNFSNVDSNLDMILLSTSLLLMEDRLATNKYRVPPLLNRFLLHQFLDFGNGNINDTNNSFVNNDEINYYKLTEIVRKCIAHSKYTVLDDNIIHFYQMRLFKDGENIDLKVNKSTIKEMFKILNDYYYFYGVFPVIIENERINTPNTLTLSEVDKYLDSLEIFDVKNLKNKKIDDYLKREVLDDDLGYDVERFSSLSLLKNDLFRKYDMYLKKHCEDDAYPELKKLTEDDINFIKETIVELGNDYFYKLSSTKQREIINQLIKVRYNKDYVIHDIVQNAVDTNYFSNSYLNNNSGLYINYKIYLELLINAFCNNLFAYCYDGNDAIDCSEIIFPKEVYEAYERSASADYFKKMEEVNDYRYLYDLMLKTNGTGFNDEADWKNLKDNLSRSIGELESIKNGRNGRNGMESGIIEKKEKLQRIYDDVATPDNYNQINKYILEGMRNCLAHGRLRLSNVKINDIGSTVLSIRNVYKGEVKMSFDIQFSQLINCITNNKFINSVLNLNSNFERYKNR